MGEIDIIAQLSDLKEIDYKNTLALASLIEVLIQKGYIARNDVASMAQELDLITEDNIKNLSM